MSPKRIKYKLRNGFEHYWGNKNYRCSRFSPITEVTCPPFVPSWSDRKWSCRSRSCCGCCSCCFTDAGFIVTFHLRVHTKTNRTIIWTLSEFLSFTIPFPIVQARKWSWKILTATFSFNYLKSCLPIIDSGSGARALGTSSSGCLNTTVVASTGCRAIKKYYVCEPLSIQLS